MIVLEKVPATLRPGSTVIGSGTVSVGERAVITKVTEMQLIFDVDVTKHLKAIEDLFPNIKVYVDMVAGNDALKGEDRTARTKLPELDLAVFYGDKGECVFETAQVNVKSKAQLKIDEDGECVLVLRPRVKIPEDALASVLQLTSCDVRISMKQAQQDISTLTEVANADGGGEVVKKEKPATKGRAKKGAAVAAAVNAEEDPFGAGKENATTH